MNHSEFALFAQHTRIPTSPRIICFCVIWVCISSSSSSMFNNLGECSILTPQKRRVSAYILVPACGLSSIKLLLSAER